MRTRTIVAAIAAATLIAAPAAAHERPAYSPDDPTSWACQVDPDDPHRHPDETCHDGHDPDDCDLADRTDDGWCPDGPGIPDGPIDVPELEIVSDPDGITDVEPDPDVEPAVHEHEPAPELAPAVVLVDAEITPAPPITYELPPAVNYVPWGSVR